VQEGPIFVRVAPQTRQEPTVADVLIGSFGLTGVLVLFSLVLAGLFAVVLIRRNKRRPPELDRPPSIT
jgi:hypothetical protein